MMQRKHLTLTFTALLLVLLLLLSACAQTLANGQPSQTDAPDSSTDTEAPVQPETPETPIQTETVVRNTDPVRSNPDSDGKTVRFYLALPREIVENENRTFYLAPAGVDGTRRSLKLEDGHLHAEESLRETAAHKYDFYLFRVEVELPEHTQPIYDLRSVDNDAMEGTSPTYWTQIHIADEATVVRIAPRDWVLYEDDFSRAPTGELMGLSAVHYGSEYVSVEQRTLPCSDCPAEWVGLEQYTDCSVVYTTTWYYKKPFLPEIEREEASNRVTFFASVYNGGGTWTAYISPEGAEDWVRLYGDSEQVTREYCENSMGIHGYDCNMIRFTVTFSQPVTTNLFEIKWVVEDEMVEGAPYETSHWHNLRLSDTVLLRPLSTGADWVDYPAAEGYIYEPLICCDECPEEWHIVRRN